MTLANGLCPPELEDADGRPLVTFSDLMIRTKKKRMVPLVPNEVQTIYLDLLAEKYGPVYEGKGRRRQLVTPGFDWRNGQYTLRGVREDILKARQQGMSTIWLGLYFLDTINNPLTQTLIVAHDSDTTELLFQIVHRFYMNLPPHKKRPKKYSNRREIRFADNDSVIYVGTAGASNLGRSQTINNVHMCLSPSQKVIGPDGFVYPIYAPPEHVVDGRGKLIRVCSVAKTEHRGERILRIGTMGSPQDPLELTKDHRVLTREFKTGRPIWKEAGDITTEDYIAYPLRDPMRHRHSFDLPHISGCMHVADSVAADEKLGRVVGWYLAEGSPIRNVGGELSGIQFTVHRDEVPEVSALLDEFSACFTSKRESHGQDCLTSTVTVYGRIFAEFLVGMFGHGDGKRIPDQVWNCTYAFLTGLVGGFTDGDGSFTTIGCVSLSTVRQQLAVQLKRLLLALRVGYPSVYERDETDQYGRNNSRKWIVTVGGPGNVKLRRMLGKPVPPPSDNKKRWIEDHPNHTYGRHQWRRGKDYYWARVNRIEEIDAPEFMYDLVLESDPHSYVVLGGVVHNSERAFWADGNDVESGLMESVPDDGNVTRETTANGFNDYYAQRLQINEGNSLFTPRFFGWFLNSEYRTPPPKEFVRTEKEQKLAEAFDLDDAQLYWYRLKGIGNPKKRSQEYPSTEEEAFIVSGNPYFDRALLVEILNRLKGVDFKPLPAHAVAVPFEVDFNKEADGFEQRQLLTPYLKSDDTVNPPDLQVWDLPKKGRQYIISADTAEGINDRGDHDYDSADVFDAETWQQVAHLHGRYDPTEYGLMLAALGWWYNTALVGVERNNHGHTVISSLLNIAHYPLMTRFPGGAGGIYEHQEYDENLKPTVMRAGWPTTAKSKPVALDGLAISVTNADIKIRNIGTITEMMSYVKLPNNKSGAESGHDDRVTSAAIADVLLKMRPVSRARMAPMEAPPPEAHVKALDEMAVREQAARSALPPEIAEHLARLKGTFDHGPLG